MLPTLYIPHGGGPCFFMDAPPDDPQRWDGLASYLREIDASLGARPRAVLVISGHWETDQPTVNVAEWPTLLFDYYGFPDQTYRLKYPVAGAPDLEPRVRSLLAAAGFDLKVDSKRGLDHGVFVPFMLIYPRADVPIMQLSLQHNLDPGQHLAADVGVDGMVPQAAGLEQRVGHPDIGVGGGVGVQHFPLAVGASAP